MEDRFFGGKHREFSEHKMNEMGMLCNEFSYYISKLGIAETMCTVAHPIQVKTEISQSELLYERQSGRH